MPRRCGHLDKAGPLALLSRVCKMGTVPDFRRPCENSGTVLFLLHEKLPMPPTPGHPQPQSTVLDRPIRRIPPPLRNLGAVLFLPPRDLLNCPLIMLG